MTQHQQQIHELLNTNNIQYKSLHHEATPTSQDSARVRGEELSTGGKALVLRHRDDQADDESTVSVFAVFVLSASRKLDTKSIKREFKTKNVRFATAEELAALTGGLRPGSVPPFGRPVIDLDLFVDTSIVENSVIAFNCGSLTDSVVMSVQDYLGIAVPTKIFPFSK
jgi:prolyl-tRNA editing enzyme YbaK/EbsC (Cys-tRNA(Pro) deacylase)